MKMYLFPLQFTAALSILISSFWICGTVSSQSSVPIVTIRFANPEWNATTAQYCVDVEFLADTTDVQVFGVNVRFFYDDSILEYAGFSDFQGGYAAVYPIPPNINTSPAGPTLFGFEGPADFVNGAIQLVSTDSTPIVLDTVLWTKLFQICFDIDDADPNFASFCPSLVLDMEANPENGGFLVADEGIVITVLDPSPNMESAVAIEHVVQFNWQYVGTGTIPWGEPIEEICIELGMPLTLSAPLNLSLECTDSTDPSMTGLATASDACEGDIIITYSDGIVYGACSQDFLLTRTWTATNGCDEMVSVDQEIQVTDSTIPILTAPDDITISCVANTSPNITGMASAIDNCGQEPMVFIEGDSVADQLCTNHLVIIRSFVAVDACGNMASQTQRITIRDTIPPTFSIPTYSWLNHLSSDSSTLMYLSDTGMIMQLNTLNESSIVGMDQCDGQIIPSFSVSSSFAENCAVDGYFERRIYSWFMTDECGNSAEVQYIVDIMDDVAPVLIGVPGDEQIFCEQLPSVPYVYSDDPSQPVIILFTETIVEGDSPGTYDVYRLWSASDACGNSIVGLQHITWMPESLLECTIILPKKIACHSDKVVLKSTVIGDQEGVTYLWELIGEGSYIMNGQGTPRILIHIEETPVYVILTLTDQYGCEAVCSAWIDCKDSTPPFVRNMSVIDTTENASTLIALDESPADEQQNIGFEGIRVWPNPTVGQISMSINARQEGMLQVGIYDLLGQEMKREQVNCQAGLNTWMMDMAYMKDGSYLIRITTGEELFTKVIVLLR